MKKPFVTAFLLAILSFCGPAFAQPEGEPPQPPPPPRAPAPPPASGRVELVIDVYSARRDLHRNVEDDQAFWLWLQELKTKGYARSLIPDCPKLFHGRMPVIMQQPINEQLPDGEAGTVTVQGEAIRLADGRVQVNFSSLGRPGAKPVGEDEKDKQPVSTGLVLQAGKSRVLRLPDAYFGVILGDRIVPQPVETLVVVLRLEEAQADEGRSPYEVPDPGDVR
jgi:hypothetical protein